VITVVDCISCGPIHVEQDEDLLAPTVMRCDHVAAEDEACPEWCRHLTSVDDLDELAQQRDNADGFWDVIAQTTTDVIVPSLGLVVEGDEVRVASLADVMGLFFVQPMTCSTTDAL
jgi:hypothetical protein